MSNRSLIITIVVILLVFAGVVAVVRMRSNPTVNGTADNQEQQANQNKLSDTTQPPVNQPTPAPATATPDQVASSTPPVAETCQRDFNANKLTADKVNIQNRVVEIDVKDYGKIQVELYDKDAPKTVENFLRLTDAGYYDCLTFHRVAQNFVIQGGDPNGDGSGGKSAFGAAFADELNPDTPSYKAGYAKGVLAMANSGPNTNGSQFFIMLDDVNLPHQYTIFGKVISGQDVVDKIGQVAITPVMGPTDGSPKTPVIMQKVSIVK